MGDLYTWTTHHFCGDFFYVPIEHSLKFVDLTLLFAEYHIFHEAACAQVPPLLGIDKNDVEEVKFISHGKNQRNVGNLTRIVSQYFSDYWVLHPVKLSDPDNLKWARRWYDARIKELLWNEKPTVHEYIS
eukprot:TRINITY_DN4844_c0_g1_i2.p1 TRINITY_DN4844_c0_g1~~TRINITY_DN4844_c0_g1_i2.p1  ORF type:complete len:130 (+),score=14.87 TRINITY_DN4844_c0_g1_i2:170-559(+)